MLEIKGKYASAVCFAKVIDDKAVDQIRRMCGCRLTEGSSIRIMPDVHAGTGCTIGTTMTVRDRVCPNLVGADIGCGMYTVRLAERVVDFGAFDEAAHRLPSGMNVWDTPAESFDLTALRCFAHLRQKDRLSSSLGTLGGGNHFIEIDRAADGTLYLVIHSGSRNLGSQTAKIYQDLAVRQRSGKGELPRARRTLIDDYKARGRQGELQEALKKLEEDFEERMPDVPGDLCWLEGEGLADYLHDVEICQRFARRSREIMAGFLLERAGLHAAEAFHTIHNYIDTREGILRKGAIAAHRGEKLLIPINMRDGSVIGVGKGNPDWNFSAPHGAGRILSRTQAAQAIDMKAYREAMAGIYTTSVNEGTLDEAPMAYKSLEDIVDVIRDSVEILEVMKPVYNFKAPGEEAARKGD